MGERVVEWRFVCRLILWDGHKKKVSRNGGFLFHFPARIDGDVADDVVKPERILSVRDGGWATCDGKFIGL